ncbi:MULTISPECIES: hypothetical protein [unclassified Luteococcus]|uniref:hypothetical protein n=1 Tax=unclassified Luteococcus TaxID=2639923 RepID=UPI00313E5004
MDPNRLGNLAVIWVVIMVIFSPSFRKEYPELVQLTVIGLIMFTPLILFLGYFFVPGFIELLFWGS